MVLIFKNSNALIVNNFFNYFLNNCGIFLMPYARRCNVDLLKIIQLGLTFLDSRGNMPQGVTTWQFNFRSGG